MINIKEFINMKKLIEKPITESEIKKYEEEKIQKRDAEIINKRLMNYISDGFAYIEAKILRVANVIMNPKDYTEFRKYCRNDIDVETNASSIKLGIVAHLWGANIKVSTKQQEEKILFVSEGNKEKCELSILTIKKGE